MSRFLLLATVVITLTVSFTEACSDAKDQSIPMEFLDVKKACENQHQSAPDKLEACTKAVQDLQMDFAAENGCNCHYKRKSSKAKPKTCKPICTSDRDMYVYIAKILVEDKVLEEWSCKDGKVPKVPEFCTIAKAEGLSAEQMNLKNDCKMTYKKDKATQAKCVAEVDEHEKDFWTEHNCNCQPASRRKPVWCSSKSPAVCKDAKAKYEFMAEEMIEDKMLKKCPNGDDAEEEEEHHEGGHPQGHEGEGEEHHAEQFEDSSNRMPQQQYYEGNGMPEGYLPIKQNFDDDEGKGKKKKKKKKNSSYAGLDDGATSEGKLGDDWNDEDDDKEDDDWEDDDGATSDTGGKGWNRWNDEDDDRRKLMSAGNRRLRM